MLARARPLSHMEPSRGFASSLCILQLRFVKTVDTTRRVCPSTCGQFHPMCLCVRHCIRNFTSINLCSWMCPIRNGTPSAFCLLVDSPIHIGLYFDSGGQERLWTWQGITKCWRVLSLLCILVLLKGMNRFETVNYYAFGLFESHPENECSEGGNPQSKPSRNCNT